MPYSPSQNIPDNRDMQAPMTIKQYVSQMRKIPGGRFTMGRTYPIDDKFDHFKDEVPARQVDVSSFLLGATPITVGMWREYLRDNTSLSMPEPPKWGWNDSHPIVNVSWNDIMGIRGNGGYCAWASRITGVRLSLPSEAQFEYVAKGGKDNKYPWGNEYDDSKVWSSVKRKRNSTAPVDRRTNVFVDKYGVSDLHGNVYQWCLDGYQFYSKSFDRLGYVKIPRDPVGVGQNKCCRGSAGEDRNLAVFRSACRGHSSPDFIYHFDSFRLAAPA